MGFNLHPERETAATGGPPREPSVRDRRRDLRFGDGLLTSTPSQLRIFGRSLLDSQECAQPDAFPAFFVDHVLELVVRHEVLCVGDPGSFEVGSVRLAFQREAFLSGYVDQLFVQSRRTGTSPSASRPAHDQECIAPSSSCPSGRAHSGPAECRSRRDTAPFRSCAGGRRGARPESRAAPRPG